MENRKGTALHLKKRPTQVFAVFHFLFCIFLCSAGCGAPGEPTPPSPPVPAAISDLSAHQAGDGVELSFTLPVRSISGEKLSSPPAVEILRGPANPGGSADAKAFRVVYTIPGALVDDYRAGDRVGFTDPISPEETKAHPGEAVAYIVRTRASQKRASADSNAIAVQVFPVPAPHTIVESPVTQAPGEIVWPIPACPRCREPPLPLPAAP